MSARYMLDAVAHLQVHLEDLYTRHCASPVLDANVKVDVVRGDGEIVREVGPNAVDVADLGMAVIDLVDRDASTTL